MEEPVNLGDISNTTTTSTSTSTSSSNKENIPPPFSANQNQNNPIPANLPISRKTFRRRIRKPLDDITDIFKDSTQSSCVAQESDSVSELRPPPPPVSVSASNPRKRKASALEEMEECSMSLRMGFR